MAADVLMGHDPECGRWIRRYREAPARGRAGPPRQPPPRGRGRRSRRLIAGNPPMSCLARADGRLHAVRPPRALRRRARPSSMRRRALGVDIDSVCGGRGLCGRCQVEPSLGEFPKLGLISQADHLSAPGGVETEYGQRPRPGRRTPPRLHRRPAGDVVIDVPPESQVHRQVVRKELARRAFEIDPVVRLHYVQVAPPDAGLATGRPAAAQGRPRRRVGPDGPGGGPPGDPRPPRRARGGQPRGHRRRP